MTVIAAGAILWREEGAKLLVAIIHRGRYDDWSWPKGKVDPGETIPQAAVREIREETGLKVSLGVPLAVINYKIPSGAKKEVHYWAARVSDSALAKSKFKPSEEVAKIDWKTPAQARKLLSYEFDQGPLNQLVDLYEKGLLRTKPLIILRHAKATARSDWKGGKALDDGRRPLHAYGKQQAKALIPVLSAYAPKRVITSPWQRCKHTVAPYAEARKLKLIERHQLSELGNMKGPRRTENVIEDIILDDNSAVVCSHRPALPTILKTLSKFAPLELRKSILSAEALRPGQMIVLHVIRGTNRKGAKIVAAELQESILSE